MEPERPVATVAAGDTSGACEGGLFFQGAGRGGTLPGVTSELIQKGVISDVTQRG